jgi:hypothetical protein
MSENTTKAWKGFDKNLACRGHQFVIGETHTIKGEPRICAHGFHACEQPLDVLIYYPVATSRFAEVILHGNVVRHDDDSKAAVATIEIVREVSYADLWRAHRAMIQEISKESSATGYRGHASATGDSGHASATGYRGHASATGDRGHASATGYSGHANATGDRGISVSIGRYGTASSRGWLVLARYDDDWNVVEVKAAKCGEGGLRPGVTYTIDEKTGEIVEATP